MCTQAARFGLHTVLCTVQCTGHSTLYCTHCTVYCSHCTVQFAVHTVLCTVQYSVYSTIYTVLYTNFNCSVLPGIALLDIWWMDHSASSVPLSLQLSDVADSGFNLLLLVLVSIHAVHGHHLIDGVQALVLLLLPLVELVTVYAHMLASGSLGLAFLIAVQFVEDEGKQREMGGQGKVWGAELARRHVSCTV